MPPTKPPQKRVRVTVELTSEFVGLLKAELNLKRIVPGENQVPRLTPSAALSLMVYSEAAGAPSAQTYMAIPNEWRPLLDFVPEERKVFDRSGKLVGGGAI